MPSKTHLKQATYIIILLKGTDILQKAQEEADKDLPDCENDKQILIGFRPIEEYKECILALFNEYFGEKKEKPKKLPSRQKKHGIIDKEYWRSIGIDEEQAEFLTTWYHGDKKMSD